MFASTLENTIFGYTFFEMITYAVLVCLIAKVNSVNFVYKINEELEKLGLGTSIESEKRIMIGYICWHPLTTIQELKNTSAFLKKYSLPHKILRRRLRLYSGSKIIGDIENLGLLDSSTKTGWKYKERRIKELETKICNFIDIVDYERDRIRTIEKWTVRFCNQNINIKYFKKLRLSIDNLCFEYFDKAVEIAEKNNIKFCDKLDKFDNEMKNKYNAIINDEVIEKIEKALKLLDIPQNTVDLFRK